MMVNLSQVSPPYVTRDKAVRAFQKISGKLKKTSSDSIILIEFPDNEIISFSFIDELLQRLSNSYTQDIVVLLSQGEKSQLYDKLARFSGLRDETIFIAGSVKDSPVKVKPRSVVTIDEPTFEEKPTSK